MKDFKQVSIAKKAVTVVGYSVLAFHVSMATFFGVKAGLKTAHDKWICSQSLECQFKKALQKSYEESMKELSPAKHDNFAPAMDFVG